MGGIFVDKNKKIMTINGALVVSNKTGLYTDNFQAYSAGALAGQGNWVYTRPSTTGVVIEDFAGDKRVKTNSATDCIVHLTGSFPNNQYAQLKMDVGGSGNFSGPAVRCSTGGNCYEINTDGGNIYVTVFVNDIWVTDLDSAPISLVSGDIIFVSIIGNTLKVLKNGLPITNLGDANGEMSAGGHLSSGAPGLMAYTNNGNVAWGWDDFECTAPN